MMINRELEDVYRYVDEAYILCVKKYLENVTLDDDIDVIADKLAEIVYEICLNYIDYDDLALNILFDNIYDFTYEYNNIGIDFTLMEVIENPIEYCNMFISDLVLQKISETYEMLEDNIEYFFTEYQDINENTEKLYREMFEETFF